MTQNRFKSYREKRTAFFVLGISAAAIFGGAMSVYSLVGDLPNPERLSERTVEESTQIYDRTGKVLLYEIHGDERRTVVPLADIPDSVKQAALVAEDINFYSHGGLDWRGIFRAIGKNISAGDFSQGGSTITQQLIKNSLLGSQKTISRKLKEQILAVLLERKYSKDEIFGWYLNQIPYGSNAYGISAAARLYFGKEVGELTLAESAAIAALVKAPTYYSPYGSHKDELLRRKDWILERMADAGFISPEESDAAVHAPLAFVPMREAIRAPHFIQFVREYLDETYGEAVVLKGGLRVTTTLDWTLQEEAEKIVREGAEANKNLVKAYNAALVAVDPRSGDIVAMVGSKEYMGDAEPAGCTAGITCAFDPYVNIATRRRQPGSAFKPFVYATAFKKGYTPETVLFDVPTEFHPACNPDGSPGPLISDQKQCYHPQNYDDTFRGPVDLRHALAQSLNVPSVKTLYLAGMEDAIKTAEDMGITTLDDPRRYGLSLVLGGAEVTLLEMTSAFGVFATEGVRHPVSAILRVEDRNGITLEEKRDISVPAMDTNIARVMNSVLSDNDARVPIFSPSSSLFFRDRQVAAKTGTTQDFRDAWTIGYTPSLAAGVWVGNNDNTPMNQKGLSVMVAGPIWHKFMEIALAVGPREYFAVPDPLSAGKPIFRGSYRAGPAVKIDKISGKLATADTPPELIEEKTFGGITTILGLVDRNNPLGQAPADPGNSDPQFRNWQAGIDGWIGAHPFPIVKAPEGADDLHAADKAPKIFIVTPGESGASLAELDEVAARVDAPFALSEVSFFIDDMLVRSATAPFVSSHFLFRVPAPLSPGSHFIKITAFDAVGNRASAERQITIIK
ncbi:MAG: putative penicillin-binding protein [Parcubacteria group bacterium Greene0714_36]|nr:MAG: putative penicillin-binding protein [Parcubacteria group bacterium Greene0714_36]